MKVEQLIGCDYGAKTRRTTAICRMQSNRQLVVELVPPNKNPDDWIQSYVKEHQVKMVFLDAPLSLPLIYRDPNDLESTYHFRKADLELKAMSPMFLGGLTARAANLRAKFAAQGVRVLETYPRAVKKSMNKDFLNEISSRTGLIVNEGYVKNSHMVDSVLAWYAGYKFLKGFGEVFGREIEGLIHC